jgi:hypothetical protein
MATLAPKLPYTHPFAGGFPYRGSQRLPSDPDALTYLAAVAAADGAPVETAVAVAVDDFFKGTKADGTFSAIKAACLLCGARTLAGALVPLAGDAPTNYNFVDADYNRETGLVGNGSTKYLDSNRANDDDPQDSNHNAVYCSAAATALSGYLCSVSGANGANQLFPNTSLGTLNFRNRRASGTGSSLSGYDTATGFLGHSRASFSEYFIRASGSDFTASLAREDADSNNLAVFKFGVSGFYSDARLAFYSIGESISDLALLDARVTALVTSIGAAL